MNTAIKDIITASDTDRRDLFITAAQRLGTTVQNIEKDFWVCWALDALFHGLPKNSPRLLFKGGTSLSKAYSLISRFSEDIDVTVFRADLGEGASLEELENLSNKKQNRALAEIKASCQAYINGTLLSDLNQIALQTMEHAGKDPKLLQVVLDEQDPDKQSLLIHYPSTVEKSEYVVPSIKIESGAKSALDPHEPRIVAPYLSADVRNPDSLVIADVTTIQPERTLLDKILILHGLRAFFEATGQLRGNGRMSRHYYDVHQLMAGPLGPTACKDDSLIKNCVRHANFFFYRANTGLEYAARGSFRLVPPDSMKGLLHQDYEAMATMIFGQVPDFDSVMESISIAEHLLNDIWAHDALEVRRSH